MSKTISFAGSGKLAWHLAPALDNAGYAVREVYSRNPGHAEKLVERLYEAEVKASLDFSTSNSDIFILAVADDALDDVVREIILPEEAILVHTSGSQPLSKLSYAATLFTGVFYPLQNFDKSRSIDFRDVPVFIETEQDEVEEELLRMGKAISRIVKSVDARERKALHVASVFASQFTSYMLDCARKIIEQHELSFEWLTPLIAESINRNLAMGMKSVQGGPANLGDFETLDQHMDFLKSDARLAELYRVISQHIIDESFNKED
jgi:predicted short-subunit dehydrogenase-like oxidoreductase (DUF2520 family)